MKYIIYSITPINTEIRYAYIGSTTNFKSRKNGHKTNCNNNKSNQYNYSIYKIIREHNGFDMWEMKPLEECECETKIQARIKERYWYDKYITDGYNMCNDRRPHITEEEHNALYAKESEWYKVNKDRTNVKQKQMRNDLISLKEENEKLKELLRQNNIEF